MQAHDLLDRLDVCLAAVEESGTSGGCPYCAWHVEDGPQHPTSCRLGAMRGVLDELDERADPAAADPTRVLEAAAAAPAVPAAATVSASLS